MYRFLAFIMLFTACNSSNKQEKAVSPSKVDSLFSFFRKTVNPYLDIKEPETAGKLLDSVAPIVKKINNPSLTSRWLLYKRGQNNVAGNQDSARFFLNEALKLSQREGAPAKEQLEVKGDLLDQLKDEKKYDSALKVGNELYFLAKKVDTIRVAQICHELVLIYNFLEDLPSARKYLFEGFERAQGDLKGHFANNIASYYDRYGQTDSAIYYFEIMQKDTIPKSEDLQATLDESWGIFLIRKNKFKEGLKHQLKAFETFKQLGLIDAIAYLNLAETYFKLKQHKLVDSYLDTTLLLAAKEKDYSIQKEGWLIKAKNYEAQKAFRIGYAALDSAFTYYQLEIDSSLAKYARDLETKYAVKAKDEEIASLSFQNKVNQKIRSQQRIIIITMIIATLLLGTIGVLLWRRKQIKTKLHESELQQMVLRNQIDPHFISNSLSVLQGFIRSVNTNKAVEYNLQLSRLLRISFEIAGKSLVPLKDEIDFLTRYLSLQAIQWNDKFEYKIDAYPNYQSDNALIPPMILQPFVENAVMHGFANLKYKGMIIVKVARTRYSLHCDVEDNGIGLQNAEPGTAKRSHSTDVTKQRLMLLNRKTGRPATLNIIDKAKIGEGPGVRISIEIPILQTAAYAIEKRPLQSHNGEFQKSSSENEMIDFS